ncbi:MAG TPA: DUF6158 family protein [Mycobacteriales bacterium]|nr:DUF6158 family protein [Mycobacteriales bacterium]
MTTSTRRPARDLDDADLEREVEHLHETRHETFLNGSADSFQAHTDRMLELESEYAQRFPDRTAPDPMRTREGSREQDGRGA